MVFLYLIARLGKTTLQNLLSNRSWMMRLATIAIFFAASLALTAEVKADSVTLDTGTVSVQVPPGQTSISISGPQNFSLDYFNSEYAGPLSTSFGFQNITQGFGSLSLNGLSASFFTGSLSFTNSTLTGSATGYASLNDVANNNPLFTVTFSGAGVLLSTSTTRTFTVSSVPEPTSLILLMSSFGAGIAFWKRRSAKD
jgi:hypothetical protein